MSSLLFVLTQKVTKKSRLGIFGGQLPSQILKEKNSAEASNSFSFYGFFDGLTLASRSLCQGL